MRDAGGTSGAGSSSRIQDRSVGGGVASRLLSGPRPLIALALLQVTVALLVWSPFPAGVWHDDGVYLLLGRALAEGEGLRYHGIAGAYPAPKFPPLYPLTLAGLWSLMPDVGSVTLAAGILNLGFLVVACLAFYGLLRVLRFGRGPAAGLAALGWTPVAIWRSALVPFSEPLFLALVSGTLALACTLERGPSRSDAPGSGEREGAPGTKGWLGVGTGIWACMALVLLASIHVRTVGVALAGAVGVALWVGGGRRAAVATLGVVGAGMLPWTVWSSLASARIPEPLRDVLGSYGGWLVSQMVDYPAAYLGGLHRGALDLLRRILAVFLPAVPSWETWFGDLRFLGLIFLLPAFFLGLDRIWARSRTVVLFLFFYLVIVWLWPFQATRLLVPLVPVLVLTVSVGFFGSHGERGDGGSGEAADEGTDTGRGRRGGLDPRRPLPPGVVRAWRGLGVVWVAVFVGISAWNLGSGWAGAGFRVNAGSLARTIQAVEEVTPPGSVVGAPEFWAAIPLHADRIGAPSARFLPARSPEAGPSWGSPEEQHRIWALTGIEYLVLEQRGAIQGAALDAVVEACGPRSVRRLASWPEGRLVRLDWDAECRSRLGLPVDLTLQGRVDPLVGAAAQE